MAVTKLVRPQIPVTQVGPPTPHIPKMMTMIAHGTTSATPHLLWKKISGSRFGDFSSGFRPIGVSDQSSIFINGEEEEEEEEATDPRTISQIKAHLYESLQGINRGIFGAPSEKKSEIVALVNALESRNPLPEPTLSLDKVAGCWRLVYSTITILGPKRTKLGLRDFISLGDFLQFINLPEEKAVNVVMFNVRGLNLFNGQLRIEASFRIASKSRVEIQYDKSTITPDQLMNVFRKNYNMLLEIFNPEGWLEITYVDDTLRIGRDDKGNIFVLERHQVP